MADREQNLLNQAHQLGITTHLTRDLPAGRRGEWNATTREIFIRDGMSDTQRVCTLQHELIHAEWGHDGHQSEYVERRVNEEAAVRLISASEYPLAEITYGCNRLILARELHVTPTIIDAYQRVLERILRTPD